VRISLCIVARNEARWIRACIESARPVVDEVVVVDTGSSDATPSLAREAGAYVVTEPWPGDLGAAHDLPLRHASGDWVLSLDGDETLDPASAARLRRLIETGGHRFDGFRITIRNYAYGLSEKFRRAAPDDPLTCGALGYRPTTPVRLFRRRPAYRFVGRVHQRMEVAIERAGGRIGPSPLVIHHYGGLRSGRPKVEFYRALARRQADDEPASALAWIELGATFESRGDLPGALAAFRHARRFGKRATAAFLIGSTLIELDRPRLAIPHLKEAIAGNGRDQSPYFDRADAFECLAAAYEALAQTRRAEAAYRRALALRPDSPAALNNLADLLTARGATRQSAAIIERLLDRFPGMSAAWATLGTLHLRRGHLSAAQAAYERALSIDHHNLAAWINAGIVHAARGQERRSARAFRSVQEIRHDEAARYLAVDERLRPRQTPIPAMAPGGIVSVIADLHGGAGRVLVDAVRALRGRSHLVLCGNTESFMGQSLRSELRALGADVRPVPSPDAVRLIVRRVAPACVLEHWSDNDLMSVPGERLDGVPWIAFGHRAFPMPEGYDAYVLLSEHQRQVQGHLPSHRLHRFSNGVDLGRFRRRRQPAVPTTIAMVSRLAPAKFVRRLTDYLPPLRELRARLRIAGTGARRFEIEPGLAESDLAGVVRFVGPVSSAAMPRFLANAAIGLHLTEADEEVCPIGVLEMLAAGLPIVAEPKGAIPEMVVHGENGLLGSSEREVAGHLRRLIDDAALRRRMGAASRCMARRYSRARFDASMRTLVETVCSDRGSPRRVSRRAPPRRMERWRPRRSIVICGTPRSGSALLCEALNNTGLAGRPAYPSSFSFDVPHAGGLTPAAHLERLHMMIEERCSPNGVFAAAFSLERWQNLMRALAGGDDGKGAEGLDDALPMTSIIWVRRRDRLRQAVSWVRAMQTGLWRRTPDLAGLAMLRSRFDAAAITARVSEIDAQDVRWRELFASLKQTPTVVWYEDLARDYEGTAIRVLSSLKIPVPPDLVFGERRLMRQADEVTDAWVRRMTRYVITPSA
jgi:LPS sulfotransferase NodH/glycosyltransferase involved in cell wall biosynthesis